MIHAVRCRSMKIYNISVYGLLYIERWAMNTLDLCSVAGDVTWHSSGTQQTQGIFSNANNQLCLLYKQLQPINSPANCLSKNDYVYFRRFLFVTAIKKKNYSYIFTHASNFVWLMVAYRSRRQFRIQFQFGN